MYYLLWILAVCFLPTWIVVIALLLTGHFLAAFIISLVVAVFKLQEL